MGTAEVNGALWGARARTWSEVQEAVACPLYEDALARAGVTRGTAYLDVGCGAGMALMLAAARGAVCHGIDAAEALLQIATERLPDADLRIGELELLPWPDASFEVVTGFNSFQFAAQPVAALAEARRVARPGARVVIATWAPPERTDAAAALAALRPLLPAPPPGAPGPFALSDEAALRKLASDAGLVPRQVHDVESPFVYPDVETAVRGLNSSGVAERAMRHAGEAAVTDAHRAVVERFRQRDGSVRIGNTFRYLLASVD